MGGWVSACESALTDEAQKRGCWPVKSPWPIRRGARALAIWLLVAVTPPADAAFVPGRGTAIGQAIRDYALETGAFVPSRRPSSVQTECPSANIASPSLLDRAGFPSLMAVALSEPLGGTAPAPAVTISLSPFAYAAARDSSMIGDRRSYSHNGTLRRAAASVTIGGPLQSRDPSKAAQASNATNHVTTELKLRMVGSRDRREHPEKFHAAIRLGEHISKGDPAFHFRAFVLDRQASKTRTIKPGYVVAMLIKAWNYELENKSISRLAVRVASGEAFPILVGKKVK